MIRIHDKDEAKYRFWLNSRSEEDTKIIRSSFYLLTSRKDYKFGTKSIFQTDSSPNISIYGEKICVCAFDVSGATASFENSEIWLEAKTEEFAECFFKQMNCSDESQSYTVILNDETITLRLAQSPQQKFTSYITGLNKDEIVLSVLYSNKGKDMIGFDDETNGELLTDLCINSLTKIEVLFKLYSIREMKPNRISKITERIFKSFSDSLMSKPSDDCMESSAVVLPNTNEPTLITKLQGMTAPTAISTTKAKQLSTIDTIFADKTFCDITIEIDGGQQIRAHKFVLASGSTIWQQLLTHDEKLSTLSLPNLDIEIIDALMTFIYTGTISEPPKATQDLLIAADTYGIDDLKIWCEERLLNTIIIDSAINLLVLAHKYNAKQLFKKAVSFVRQNATELKQRDEWKTIFFAYPELAIEIFNIISS